MPTPGQHVMMTGDPLAYEWSEEFVTGQPLAYAAQNDPYVTRMNQLCAQIDSQDTIAGNLRTVDDLIREFLSILGDGEMPHGPSTYQGLELRAFCAPGSLDILTMGRGHHTMFARALLDDRSRTGHRALQAAPGGQRRDNNGPLNATQLVRELQKKRYECDNEPDAARRLIYVADPDGWMILALAFTASTHQALFLTEFFYKYLGFKTSLGIHRPPRGIPLFALEFHLQFYVWREDEALIEDRRRKRSGKPLRRSRALHDLDIEEDDRVSEISKANIYEAQISCLVTGVDHDSWIAYLFVDTYYQGDSSYESVEHYHSRRNAPFRPDPLLAGTADANLPTWTPREYFLCVYECRIRQVKHALHNVVSRLLLKLEPYVEDPTNLLRLPDYEGTLSFRRKKQLQQMVNEASRLLRQTIHSICRAIEVWDRFNHRDAVYLSDIMIPRGSRDENSRPFRVVALIGDHINDLRDLQRRTEELQELCTGLARELEIQLFMEDNKNSNQQQENGELVKTLTVIGLLFLPFTATAALFSMQPGVLPSEAVSAKVFFICWLSLTVMVFAVSFICKGPFQLDKWIWKQTPVLHQLTQSQQQGVIPAARTSLFSARLEGVHGYRSFLNADSINLDIRQRGTERGRSPPISSYGYSMQDRL